MFGNRARLRLDETKSAILLTLLAGLLLPAPATAQPSLAGLVTPRLHTVAPCGGKAGTSVEVTVSGLGLDDAENLVFSQPGIKAELVDSSAPQPKAKPQPKKGKKPRGQPFVPPGAVKFKVSIPADTRLGIHDVRIVTKGGISNPRAFVVGDLAEVSEKEPNNDVAQAQRVDLNTTIHGAITSPTDVDYFVFAGTKGQRVVVSCLSSSIDSRLPAAVELYDKDDHLLGTNRSYHGSDALLDCTLPDDGDYYLRLFAFTYTQGSIEHFYRLTISTAPWIDAVYPPMIEPGKRAQLTVYGRNLPGGKLDPKAKIDGRVLEKLTVTVEAPKEPAARQRLAYSGRIAPRSSALDGFEYRLRNASGASNPVLLTYAQAPVVLDNGDNDTAETAQEITLPCEIAGRIEKKRDRDWYVFQAKKGEVYSIEAFGDRLGSAIDLFFVLRNARTKQVLIEMDDNPDPLGRGQFYARSEDPPRYRFVVPADGEYLLQIASREADVQAGPRDFYRLRIVPEQPDFRLIVMPSAANNPDASILRQSGHQDLSIFVWRLDGWNGPITVTAEGLPEGVACPPVTIGPGVREGSLVLQADAEAPLWAGAITVKGSATIKGQAVVREARPATITWAVPQPNIPTISRLDRSLVLAVRGKAPYVLDAGIEKAVALHGTKLTIPVKLTRLWPNFKYPVQVLAMNLPGTPPLRPLILTPGKDEAKVVLNIQPNIPPGVYTLVLRGRAQFVAGRKKNRPGQAIIVQPASPITITVLPRQLATVSLSPGKLKVEAGSQTEVLVKIAQKYAFFAGEFKVQLVSSKTKGFRAEEVTIPEGKDRAKLTVEVDPEVKPGTSASLIVRVTALVNDTPIQQDTRLDVNIVK
jgi:hypothetical protein